MTDTLTANGPWEPVEIIIDGSGARTLHRRKQPEDDGSASRAHFSDALAEALGELVSSDAIRSYASIAGQIKEREHSLEVARARLVELQATRARIIAEAPANLAKQLRELDGRIEKTTAEITEAEQDVATLTGAVKGSRDRAEAARVECLTRFCREAEKPLQRQADGARAEITAALQPRFDRLRGFTRAQDMLRRMDLGASASLESLVQAARGMDKQ